MSSTLALHESQHLAEDLYALLRSMDPARWRQDMEPAVRQRMQSLRERLHHLLDEIEWPAAFENLRERLEGLRQVLQEATTQQDGPIQWEEVRRRLMPAYEAVAASLKVQSIHVPSLRPTNYTRNIFHVFSGFVVLMIFHHALSMEQLTWLGAAAAGTAWSLELGRRYSVRLNRVLMAIFGKVAHPHESHRVNSSTWYTTALFLLAWLMEPVAAALAVSVLAVSDPAAALVGRRFGRHRLVAGRTVEGSLAFVAAGFLVAMLVLHIYYGELSLSHMALLALGGTLAGAVAELVSERVDDNFSIPMSVACGVTVVGWLIG